MQEIAVAPSELQNIKLIAVLAAIGSAFLAGLVSFAVNWITKRKNEKTHRRRTALVLLDRAAEIIAMGDVAKKLSEPYVNIFSELTDEIGPDFEMSHATCVLVAKHLDEMPEEKLQGLEEDAAVIGMVRDEMTRSMDYDVPIEVLAHFPPEVISKYTLFKSYAPTIALTFSALEEFLRTGNRALVTATQLYSHWTNIQELLLSARVFAAAIKNHANVTDKDLAQMIVIHSHAKARSARISIHGETMIKAATKSINEDDEPDDSEA